MKKVALYLRVSTREQDTENQRIELERVAMAKGWSIYRVYEDAGVSGAARREDRPAYNQLMRDAVRSKFNVVMAWDVSRLGRSLGGLVNALEEFHSSGVDLYLHQQALDTTTPAGKALFQMCGVFAEFERSMISERVKLGLKRARRDGAKLGRPPTGIVVERFLADLNAGLSIRQLAKKHGVSVGRAHMEVVKLRANPDLV